MIQWIYADLSWVSNVANHSLLRCKICGLEIRQCKKNDKYHVWSRRGCFAKAKFGFLLSIRLHSSVFWNKFPTYHRSSLEMADSYSFMGDVCPVFTSPPLIPPNWSCLQRDSVSTHRRRHRIRYLPLSPLNLNLVHTLGKISSCLSPAVQCSVFANKSGHCAPWSEKTSFVHLTTFSSR